MQEQAPNPAVEDAASADMPEGALSNDQLEELDALLDEMRTRGDEIPQWEFCDGFLTALVCTRRPIEAAEYLPMLLGEPCSSQYDRGDASRWAGSTSTRSPATSASATSGSRAMARPCPASAACTI